MESIDKETYRNIAKRLDNQLDITYNIYHNQVMMNRMSDFEICVENARNENPILDTFSTFLWRIKSEHATKRERKIVSKIEKLCQDEKSPNPWKLLSLIPSRQLTENHYSTCRKIVELIINSLGVGYWKEKPDYWYEHRSGGVYKPKIYSRVNDLFKVDL